LNTLAATNTFSPASTAHISSGVWFAVRTWPRYEKRVANELQEKDLNVFLPLLASRRQWSDRKQTVQLPLFPGYLFVRIPETLETRLAVLRTNGVTNFVGVRGAGIPIPECEIESVRSLLTLGIPILVHPFLNVGQRVRVRGGSLDGVEGILLAKNDNLSLIISIQLIQRSVSIRISGYQVEAA
jgi:transcription termination/antitermination protein NusG